MNFYKHYIGDFDRDTSHLSLVERGAYLALLHRIYATERGLPNDMVAIYRIVRASTKSEKAAVQRVLGEFFSLVDGCYFNARSRTELASAKRVRETNTEVGKRGGRPKKTATYETESVSDRFPNENRTGKPSRYQIPDTRSRNTKVESSVANSCVISSFPASELAREPDENFERWLIVKASYPPFPARADWIAAERTVRRLVDSGVDWGELIAGTKRYAAHVAATGRLVLNPARFFGDADRPWSQPWPIPQSRAERNQSADIAAAIAWAGGSNGTV